jgi:hypothetical protein
MGVKLITSIQNNRQICLEVVILVVHKSINIQGTDAGAMRARKKQRGG